MSERRINAVIHVVTAGLVQTVAVVANTVGAYVLATVVIMGMGIVYIITDGSDHR